MSYTDQTTSSYGSNTITAFFDSQAEATRAIERLVSAGISRESVRLIADTGSDTHRTSTMHDDGKGFWASLADLFMPDDDRTAYAEGIRRGGFLVTVSDYPANLSDTALDILDDEGSIDIDERARSWESEGWSRSSAAYAAGDSEYAGRSGSAGQSGYEGTRDSATSTDLDADGEEVIPVVQEDLRIGKRDVNNGRVRVRSYVVETPVNESVSLRDERVEVSRRAVDRPLSDADTAFTDRTISAEEHREEAVVSKDARVVEEISLKKTAEQRQETISDSVRKTEVEVEDERESGLRNSGTTGFRRD
ncbi:YsnF/AvaK domain-containing protein [Rhizobium sp. YIM 134829]|uniref:YsnF/AvaK domain-containing protein n=1 Tax=Rhizobium sp. YIM 134829 TaxID=3390453 RepID=UPI00397A8B01